MSFNKTIFFSSDHPTGGGDIIHRGNYEEWFLLYTDNELSDEQKKTVEAFIAENTDLKQELELLFATKCIDNNNISASFKEALLKNEMEEVLLLYIDNELDGENRKELEQRLNNDERLKQSFSELKNTVSKPDKNIVFKYKAALYKEENSVKKPLLINRFIRYAAAASVIGFAIAAIWLLTNKSKTLPPVYVSKTLTNSNTPPTISEKVVVTEKQLITAADQSTISQENSRANMPLKYSNPSPQASFTEAITLETNHAQTTWVIENSTYLEEASDLNKTSNEEKLSADRNIIVASNVTPSEENNASTFTQTEVNEIVNQTKNSQIDTEENITRKNTLRGLFRQVKHNIERRVPLPTESDKVSLFFFTVKDNR